MKRFVRSLAMVLAALVVIAVGVVWYARRSNRPYPATYVAADSTLRRPYLFFYPSRTAERARAIIVLFGNDIGFWEPHQMLAWRFSGDGYDVVGLDLRKYLSTLPDEPARDAAFAAGITATIARARHELRADSLPIVVGGHSFGAEVAFWVGLHVPPPKLVGVLSLNSRSTGHLFITPADWMNKEASGPYSFSAVQAAKEIDPRVRIALVRSGKDPFRAHDPEFVAAGGARLERFVIPLASHSMTTMLTAGPVISRAVRFLFDSSSKRN